MGIDCPMTLNPIFFSCEINQARSRQMCRNLETYLNEGNETPIVSLTRFRVIEMFYVGKPG